MKSKIALVMVCMFLYSSYSTSSINEKINLDVNPDSTLKAACKNMGGTIKTGHILFHAVNHLESTEWAGIAIRFKTIEGTQENYETSEGKSGRSDGYNAMMYAITSQSRLLNELVDICVKGKNVFGMETYAIDL